MSPFSMNSFVKLVEQVKSIPDTVETEKLEHE